MTSLLRSGRVAPHSLAGASYDQLVIADGPAAYYRLQEATYDGVMHDSSGAGLNGTFSASPTLAQAGPLAAGGYSMSGFDSSHYGAIASSLSFDDHSSLTIEFWLKYTSANSKACPVYLGSNSTERIAPQWWTDGNIYWDDGTTATGRSSFGMPSGDVGVWAMYDFIVDATAGRSYIYINGVQKANQAWTAGSQSWSGFGTIGVWQGSTDYTTLAGNLAEVALYKKAVTATNMLARYNKAISG